MPSRVAGLVAAFFLALSGAGCSCGSEISNGGDDAGVSPDGGAQDAGPDGGPQCVALGAGCAASNVSCCEGVCSGDGFCRIPGDTTCAGAGQDCNSSGDCCAGRTCGTDLKCSAAQCKQVGASCTDGNQCCTLTCAGNGQCAELTASPTLPGGSTAACLGGATKVIGQSCGADSECCSNNCQGGMCVRSYFCQATGDICTASDDCCSGRCSSTDGTPGRCFQSTGGRGLDGNPCTTGNDCATRICTDLGLGAKVCTPATGCSVTDNACATNDECCGGMPPYSDVSCVDFRCNNGTSCNEPGTVCKEAKLPDGGTVQVNAPPSNTCCEDVNNGATCKLDTAGIPRCFGGGSGQCPTGYTGEAGCCIAEAQSCSFKDQCCDGKLCLPNADGGVGYTCQGTTCSPVGTTCEPGSATSTCCAGTQCLPAFVGELPSGFACQVPQVGADGGTTPDAGPTCRLNDSTCSAGGDCCSGICGTKPGTSGTVCLPPATCQPQNGVCTSGADCCAGFQCVQGSTGQQTCQPGGCSSAGQSCTSGSQCCSGTTCLNTSGGACDGTSACACTVIIG